MKTSTLTQGIMSGCHIKYMAFYCKDNIDCNSMIIGNISYVIRDTLLLVGMESY
jgi:hypothetical protein